MKSFGYETITHADQAARVLDEIAPLYEAVFAEPPYFEGARDRAAFLEGFEVFRAMPGFRLVLARDEELIGFAFGIPLRSDSGWWDGLDLDGEFTAEDGRRSFVIRELAVARAHRQRGIGRVLHDTLTDGLAVERLTLAVRPEAVAAVRLYERLGYAAVGDMTPSWEGAPVYRCLVKALG